MEFLPPAPDDISEPESIIEEDLENTPTDVVTMMRNATQNVMGTTDLFFPDPDSIKDLESSGFFSTKKSHKSKSKSTITSILDQSQSHRLGEANLQFSIGNIDVALNSLQVLVKETPSAYEPWLTIGTIYQEKGELTKSQGSFFMAAHLNRQDFSLWKRLASQSIHLHQIDQAIYCLTKAIRASSGLDVDAIWDRTCLYLNQSNFSKAIDGFQSILVIDKLHVPVIKELSKLYVRFNQYEKAIELFEPLLKEDDRIQSKQRQNPQNTNQSNLLQNVNEYKVGLDELNMICDLYFESQQYEQAYNTIVLVLQRHPNIPVPVEINTKADICRLNLGHSTNEIQLFSHLFQSNVLLFHELFHEVIDAYMNLALYRKAIYVIEFLLNEEKTNSSIVWSKLAKCHQQLGEYDESLELYSSESSPNNSHVLMELAKLFIQLGNQKKASECLSKVDEISKQESQSQLIPSLQSTTIESNQELMPAIIPNKKNRKEDSINTRLAHQIRDAKVRSMYEKLCNLFPQISDRIILIDLITVSRKLLLHFQYDKNQTRILDPGGRLDRTLIQLGLSIREWIQVFIKTAFILSYDGRSEDAFSLLKSAYDSKLFSKDVTILNQFKLNMLACAIYNKDFQRVAETSRWFINERPLENEPIQLYNLVLNGGPEAITAYASALNQRFFLRLIQSFESSSSEYSKKYQSQLKLEIPMVYSLMGHIFLSARTWRIALKFYSKALKSSPKDPLILLCMGVSLLHGSMSRNVINRHDQISRVQFLFHPNKAFYYLFAYFETRNVSSEAHYNIARSFHQIGLFHLAVPHYQTVLDNNHELVFEAAYNLSLIYVCNGSPQLSCHLLKKYCTF